MWSVVAAIAGTLLLRWTLLSVAMRRFQIPVFFLLVPVLELIYLLLSAAWTIRASAGRPVDA
jgi:hypothetical protein